MTWVRCPYCKGQGFVPAWDTRERHPDTINPPRVTCPYCLRTKRLFINGVPSRENVQAKIREIERTWNREG